ncbi:MAG: T9SS type A sorting domain-containing protein [Flavobacteriales bacterium]
MIHRTASCTLGMLFVLRTCAQFGEQKIAWEPETGSPHQLVSVDLDNDGVRDVLVLSASHWGISWFKIDGTGQAVSHHRLAQISVLASGPGHKLDAADVDQDGDMDVFATGSFGFPVSIDGLYLIRNLGGGIFGAPEQILPGVLYHFQLGDMDSDGDIDLVTGDVYANDGNGSFSNVATFFTLEPVIVLDMDGDGDLDFVDPYNGDWYEQITGPFVEHTSGQAFLGDFLQAVDLDLDGDMDMLSVDDYYSTIRWRENDGTGTFGPTTLLYDYSQGDDLHVVVFDMDLDGDLDLITCINAFSQERIHWIENTGSLSFPVSNSLALVLDDVAYLMPSDTNGDGLTDVLAASYHSRVYSYLNNGGAQLDPGVVFNKMVDGVKDVRWGDLDGDNREDMIVASSMESTFDTSQVVWFRKLPGVGYGAPQVISTAHLGYNSVMLGDYDGDGDVDVAATALDQNLVLWFANDGNGSNWTEHLIGNASALDAWSQTVDLDQDGDADLLIACGLWSVAWYRNDGSGNFTTLNIGTASNLRRARAADFDGDGDLDVVACGDYETRWYINDGGIFSPGQALYTNSPQGSKTCLAVIDVEPDGDMDIICPDVNDTRLDLYVNDGAGVFTLGPPVITDPDINDPPFAQIDLDNDGDEDLMYDRFWITECSYNVGGGVFIEAPCPSTITPFIGGYMRVRDMDGDGDLDVVRMSAGIVTIENYSLNDLEASGTVYLDADQDGLLGPMEPGLVSQVNCAPNAEWSYALGGAYRFALDSGNYVVSPSLTAPLWTLTSDSVSYSVHLSTNDSLVDHLDFGFLPGPDSTDAAVAFSSDPTRCSSTIRQYVDVANLGNTILRGQLVVQLDPLIAFNSSTPPPSAINGQTITWAIDSVFYYSIDHIELTCAIPGVQFIGDTIVALLELTAVDSVGGIVGTFTGGWSSVIACAFDPNDKQVYPAGYGSLGVVDMSTEHLDYTVRFQNTGTASAYTVVIRDQLPGAVDPGSLHIIGASHVLSDVRIEGDGEAVFTFQGIMLPDSNANEPESHGYVRFQLNLYGGLPSGTTIQNTAEIFFDANPPVITNSTLTTLIDCGLFSSSIAQTSASVLEATEGTAYQWYLYGQPIMGGNAQECVTFFSGSYTVAVTNIYGCVLMSDPFSFVSNAVDEELLIQCAVAPNPFTDGTRLIFSEPLTSAHVLRVIDLHGSVVVELTGSGTNEMMVQRGSMAAGLYLIKILRNGVLLGAQRIAIE